MPLSSSRKELPGMEKNDLPRARRSYCIFWFELDVSLSALAFGRGACHFASV
jgi:hypothetical protein